MADFVAAAHAFLAPPPVSPIFAPGGALETLNEDVTLIVSLMLYFILMIWATIKDKKDNNALPVPVMRDNYPDDKYFYEIIVETGPKDADATTLVLRNIGSKLILVRIEL